MSRIAATALGRNIGALAIGACGGAVFAWADLPLAWMLGAMTATIIAAVAGIDVRIARQLRGVMIAVLGVMLGSAFSPDVVDRLGDWLKGALVLLLFLPVAAIVSYLLLRRFGRFDPVTAYFSASPGGFGEMVILGEEMGGDPRVISLIHATRILIVVMAVPIWYRFVVGIDVPVAAVDSGSGAIGWTDAGWLLAAFAIGWPLAHLLRLPAAALLGPTVLSAAIHILGLTVSKPPAVLVAAAQVALGTAVGSRFMGVQWARVRMAPVVSLVSTVAVLALAILATQIGARVTGIEPAALFLSLVPGGLAEMSLIALALGVETAFVSTMHIWRIALIYLAAPLGSRVIARDDAGSDQ